MGNVCVRVCVVCESVTFIYKYRRILHRRSSAVSLSTDLLVVSCSHSGTGAVPSVSGRALSLLPW